MTYYKNLVALFGNDLAIVPPKTLLKGSSGGMTKEQSEQAVRLLKKSVSRPHMAPWGQPSATSSASNKQGKAKKANLETDDALLALSDGEQEVAPKRSSKKRPATYEVDSGIEDSLDAILDGGDNDGGISVNSDEEECAAVLRDEGVEVDTHPVTQVEEELEELEALRSAARKRQSLDRGNSQDRQRFHQQSAAYNSFQKACEAVKDSHSNSKSTVSQLAEFEANDAMLAKGFINAEYHAKMKEEIQRKFAPSHFYSTKPPKAKKTLAQNSSSTSSSST
jgi:hypothetical protein